MGLLPILEVDDTVLCSSKAIAGYIAEVTGLVGKTPLDRARGEMLLDAFQDIVRPFFPKFFPEKDEAKKAELATEFVEKILPPWVARFETQLKLNGSGDGWYIGSELTFVDLAIFNFFDLISTTLQKDVSVLLPPDKVPKLSSLWHRVKEQPALDAYLKIRA
jgi:glutathione S-transferase